MFDREVAARKRDGEEERTRRRTNERRKNGKGGRGGESAFTEEERDGEKARKSEKERERDEWTTTEQDGARLNAEHVPRARLGRATGATRRGDRRGGEESGTRRRRGYRPSRDGTVVARDHAARRGPGGGASGTSRRTGRTDGGGYEETEKERKKENTRQKARLRGGEGGTARRRCVSLLAPANCRGQPALAEELTELSRTPRRQAGRQAGSRAGTRHFGSTDCAWPRVASASVDARDRRSRPASGCSRRPESRIGGRSSR